MFDDAAIDFHTLARECQREWDTRSHVYPRLVARGLMTEKLSNERMAIMAEAARLFLVEAMRRDLMQFNDTGPSSGVQCDGEGRGPP